MKDPRSIRPLRYSSRSVWHYQSCFLKYRRVQYLPAFIRSCPFLSSFLMKKLSADIKNHSIFSAFPNIARLKDRWSANLVFSGISRSCASLFFVVSLRSRAFSKSENQGASFGEDTGKPAKPYIYTRECVYPVSYSLSFAHYNLSRVVHLSCALHAEWIRTARLYSHGIFGAIRACEARKPLNLRPSGSERAGMDEWILLENGVMLAE